MSAGQTIMKRSYYEEKLEAHIGTMHQETAPVRETEDGGETRPHECYNNVFTKKVTSTIVGKYSGRP
jgi:hypothetical protein